MNFESIFADPNSGEIFDQGIIDKTAPYMEKLIKEKFGLSNKDYEDFLYFIDDDWAQYYPDPMKYYENLEEDLIQSDSEEAFKKNVETEIKAGKPRKQALAIAYSVKEKNKKKKMKEDIWGKYKRFDNWEQEDIDLYNKIDWTKTKHGEYDTGDSFIGTAVLYGADEPIEKEVEFHKFIRSNPIYPPYYRPVDDKPFDVNASYVGAMADGRKHGKYDVHDRFETQELYDMLSEDIEKKNESLKEDWEIDDNEYIDTDDDTYMHGGNRFLKYYPYHIFVYNKHTRKPIESKQKESLRYSKALELAKELSSKDNKRLYLVVDGWDPYDEDIIAFFDGGHELPKQKITLDEFESGKSLKEDYQEDQYIYLFPELTDEDKKMLKAYNLKFLGKNHGPWGDEDNWAVKGTKSDLVKYGDKWLGYELHPAYLYKEEEFAGDIIKESLGETSDGWSDEIWKTFGGTINDLQGLLAELSAYNHNGRGYYTGCKTTLDLSRYLKKIASDLYEVAFRLSSQSDELDEGILDLASSVIGNSPAALVKNTLDNVFDKEG